MRELQIDIETRSSVDLAKCGVYKYAESPDFEVLLFGYAVDGREVSVIDLKGGERIPEEIVAAIKNEKTIKTAHNASFERVCLSRYFNLPSFLPPSSWHCTLVWSSYLGLPASLRDVGAVLGLDRQKLEEGKELLRLFCVPKKSADEKEEKWNRPEDNREKWELFKKYNKRDVETEIDIEKRLAKIPVPDEIWSEYAESEKINDRGVLVDLKLVDAALQMDKKCREELMEKMKEITELENPNSVQQLRGWLGKVGVETDELGKKKVEELIKNTDGKVKEVLMLRRQLAKSSVKKYEAMKNSACQDGHVRGMFQFYGASHTGRFSSKIVQLQNLPQNHLPDLKEARALVRNGNYEALGLLYENIPDTLSQLIRTAFIPSEGSLFYVADYSAIECRVLAWLAGEDWVLKAFEDGKDIYCEMASRMYGVPVEKHGVNAELRQKGKRAVLGCGYGGGIGALKAMGAADDGMTEEEMQDVVEAYRDANPKIRKFWWDIDQAAKKVIMTRGRVQVGPVTLFYSSGFLFIMLPSGRNLAYARPRIGENRFGGESITYEGVGTGRKWTRLETYGATLVENVTQGVARDLLCNAQKNLGDKRIVMHIHDELVIEAPASAGELQEICEKMAELPDWGKGLVTRADGYITPWYRKD